MTMCKWLTSLALAMLSFSQGRILVGQERIVMQPDRGNEPHFALVRELVKENLRGATRQSIKSRGTRGITYGDSAARMESPSNDRARSQDS